MTVCTESYAEEAALTWLKGTGWQTRNGAEIAPGEPAAAKRDAYGQVVFVQRARGALARLNQPLPAEVVDDAFRKLTRLKAANLIVCNRAASPAGGLRSRIDMTTPDQITSRAAAGESDTLEFKKST